ncbi:MAG TPA: hypothetical protein VF103_10555 [Polyangiaceae bacterium]
MISRRQFVGDTVVFVLIPVVAGCGNDDGKDAAKCDGIGGTSSVDQGHSHTVCVASSDLMNPPTDGARFTTSNNSGHTHEIELSAEQLTELAGGGSVMVTATVVQGHSHTFMLEKSG